MDQVKRTYRTVKTDLKKTARGIDGTGIKGPGRQRGCVAGQSRSVRGTRAGSLTSSTGTPPRSDG